MKKAIIKIILFILVSGIFIALAGYFFGWFSETGQVIQSEFGPEAGLKKYEWFKDAAAELQKKRADIAVYEKRLRDLEKSYQNIERQKWSREDREQFNVWLSEIAGIKASYNQLAAEYNAQMAKFNWRFANTGDLPAEFKLYINE